MIPYQYGRFRNISTSRKTYQVTRTSEIMIFHFELFQYGNEIIAIDKIMANNTSAASEERNYVEQVRATIFTVVVLALEKTKDPH